MTADTVAAEQAIRSYAAEHDIPWERMTEILRTVARGGGPKTAEELKQDVREYADASQPGWDVSTVCVSRGPGNVPETLVITHLGSVP